MAKINDTIGSTPLEVFVPAAGDNPADPQDAARNTFFEQAQELHTLHGDHPETDALPRR